METEETRDFLKPTQVHDVHIIYFKVTERKKGKSYGKWMVFKHFDELDATWERVKMALLRDELQGCSHAGCSTMRYNPSVSGPGPDLIGVICVYTKQHNMDAIGFKLIEMEKHDIRYKTEQDSGDYKYSFNSSTPVSIKTIYWNDGRPSFVCEDKPQYSTSLKREDIWHLNVVDAPESLNLGEVEGRWVLFPEYKELTGLWHTLKKLVESEEDNFGIIRMICPPKRKRKCTIEKPEFHIHTSKGRRRIVGRKLIRMVEDDIVYQYMPQRYDSSSCERTGGYQHPGDERRHSGYHQQEFRGRGWESREKGYGWYYQQGCRGPGSGSREEVLYWNDGEPDYERVRRKGITKNWRTGEDIS